jgi:hypothetical protein
MEVRVWSDVCGLVNEVTNSESHKVVWHVDLVIEASLVISVECLVDSSHITTHIWCVVIINCEASSIGNTVRWSVLLWSPGSAGNSLRVGEDHWISSTRGLSCR